MSSPLLYGNRLTCMSEKAGCLDLSPFFCFPSQKGIASDLETLGRNPCSCGTDHLSLRIWSCYPWFHLWPQHLQMTPLRRSAHLCPRCLRLKPCLQQTVSSQISWLIALSHLTCHHCSLPNTFVLSFDLRTDTARWRTPKASVLKFPVFSQGHCFQLDCWTKTEIRNETSGAAETKERNSENPALFLLFLLAFHGSWFFFQCAMVAFDDDEPSICSLCLNGFTPNVWLCLKSESLLCGK